MNSRTNFLIVLISLILLMPGFSFADGGMVIWPPDVYLDQTAQNAICAWDGKEEIIILSNDIKSSKGATVLRIVPLPSNPTEIKEGSFESFEKLVEIMNEKMERERGEWMAAGKGLEEAPTPGIEITFQKEIGVHDITVVKVNDLDYFLDWVKDFAEAKGLEIKEISLEFKEGVSNYLKRDTRYFVFDVIETEGEKSIKPLIYKFDSDYLYYPLVITGISEVSQSSAKIQVFLITKDTTEELYWREFGYPVELTLEELKEVSEDVANLFNSAVKVRSFDYYGRLGALETDLMVFPQIWERNLYLGSQGEDVKALQKILINEKLWKSEVPATGFFGPITKSALIKFQERHKWEILEPLDLETGTGYFGEKTQDYLKKLSIEIEKVREEIKWDRNLTIGMQGDDVKALQEILISEGVWERPEVGATGYFGPITKSAVIKFQEKYSLEILEPLGLEKGTGFIGPSTRSFLEKK